MSNLWIARGGQMVDATIVPVSRQRNSRDENDQVEAGTTPKDWKRRPSKNRQKDEDARWTKTGPFFEVPYTSLAVSRFVQKA